jgi:hypothetical protein
MQHILESLKMTKTGKTNQPVVFEYSDGNCDELDLSFHNFPEWLTADWCGLTRHCRPGRGRSCGRPPTS